MVTKENKGASSESDKKTTFGIKIFFFSDNVELSSKTLSKIISADVKANTKQQEVKDLVAVFYNLFRSTFKT